MGESAQLVGNEEQEMKKLSIRDKWKKTGLLKNLEGTEENVMAAQLESLMGDIFKSKVLAAAKSNILLPMQRRVGEHQLSIDEKYLLVDGKRFMRLDHFMQKYNDVSAPYADFSINTMDLEVEFCKEMADRVTLFANKGTK